MKWFTRNYKDKLIRSFVKSTFAKKKLSILVMMLAAIIIRSIICSLLCVLFSYNIYVDFFLHSIISVILISESVLKIFISYMGSMSKFLANNTL